ncbi:PREDICTED: uncharacterized protein LOC106809736 [Priapulus caudatus]|uniref:Uncharacterized protein LOC106809736 n=1 Tax=Priapulus caudatus TaxID=37621 RepID=A0ABM1E893_PRICU|nr:PREDICTED: uncharacterized protein LOC106809736 [Priapulus caudatus]
MSYNSSLSALGVSLIFLTLQCIIVKRCSHALRCPESCKCYNNYSLINCSNTGLERMPVDIPVQVKSLDLTFTYIKDINISEMARLTDLELFWYLPNYLPQNWKSTEDGWQVMDKHTFSGNRKLRVLVFEAGQYRSMPADFILASNLTKLEVLKGSFQGMTEELLYQITSICPLLHELDIWGNDLAVTPSDVGPIAWTKYNTSSRPHRCNLRRVSGIGSVIMRNNTFIGDLASAVFGACPLHTLELTSLNNGLVFEPSFFDNLPKKLNITLHYQYTDNVRDYISMRSLMSSLERSHTMAVNLSLPESGAPVNVVLAMIRDHNVTEKLVGLSMDVRNCNSTCMQTSASLLRTSFFNLRTVSLVGFSGVTAIDIQEWFPSNMQSITLRSSGSNGDIMFVLPDAGRILANLTKLEIDGPEFYCSCDNTQRWPECVGTDLCAGSIITFSSCPNIIQLSLSFAPRNREPGIISYAGTGYKFSYSFSSLHSLRILTLNQYHLCNESSVYAQNPIESLVLAELYFINGIMCLEKDNFGIPVACPGLTKLSIAHTTIRSVVDYDLRQYMLRDFFKYHPNLTYLDMTGTRFSIDDSSEWLTTSDLEAISSLDHLRVLRLRDTGISSIPDSFARLQLKELDLSYNNLMRIPVALLQIDSLKHLDLRENPLICECSTIDFMHAAQRFGLLAGLPLVGYLDDPDALSCTFSDQSIALRKVHIQEDDCGLPVINIFAIVMASLILLAIVVVTYRRRRYIAYYFHVAAVRLKRYEPAVGEYEYDAFVGYSTSTGFELNWIINFLLPKMENDEVNPYRLFLEERDMPAYGMQVSNIVAFMDKSHTVILVITQTFLTDVYCNFMLKTAAMRNNVIIIFLETIATEEFPAELRVLQLHSTCLHWSENRNSQERFWKAIEYAMPLPQRDHYAPILASSNYSAVQAIWTVDRAAALPSCMPCVTTQTETDNRSNTTGNAICDNECYTYNDQWPINDDLVIKRDQIDASDTQLFLNNYSELSCLELDRIEMEILTRDNK